MQNIMLIGRLTEDAVVKSTTRQGVKNEFVSFSLACNEERGDERSATFYDVTMPKTGVVDYLKKGQMVSILGRFRFNMTEDKEGKKWPHLNVSVMDIQLTGSGKKPEAEAADAKAES